MDQGRRAAEIRIGGGFRREGERPAVHARDMVAVVGEFTRRQGGQDGGMQGRMAWETRIGTGPGNGDMHANFPGGFLNGILEKT